MSELTAELIVDQYSPHDVQIAPDAKRIAYTLAPSGKKEEHATSSIWIARIDYDREARQFTSGEAHDHHPRWSPDGSHLAFLSDRA
jgi:dipeptidyl aminopeptidase/acylaminoacyl peptidase